MTRAIRTILLLSSFFLVVSFAVFVINQTDQLVELADRFHPLAGDVAFRNLSTTMGHSTGLIREQCPVW